MGFFLETVIAHDKTQNCSSILISKKFEYRTKPVWFENHMSSSIFQNPVVNFAK